MRSPRPAPAGFTLIEMMLVVTILGVLCTVALIRFSTTIRHSSEGATKGELGALRGALMIYYGDLEGQYPTDLASLALGGKFISAIPASRVPYYHAVTSAELSTPGVCINTTNGKATAQTQAVCKVRPNRSWRSIQVTDVGGWSYANDATAGDVGTVIVNCTHTDTLGRVWSSF